MHLGQQTVGLEGLLYKLLVRHRTFGEGYRLVVEVVRELGDLPARFRTHFFGDLGVILPVEAGSLDHLMAFFGCPPDAVADLANLGLRRLLGLALVEAHGLLSLRVFLEVVFLRGRDVIRIFFLKFLTFLAQEPLRTPLHFRERLARGDCALRFQDFYGLLNFGEIADNLLDEHLNDLFGLLLVQAVGDNLLRHSETLRKQLAQLLQGVLLLGLPLRLGLLGVLLEEMVEVLFGVRGFGEWEWHGEELPGRVLVERRGAHQWGHESLSSLPVHEVTRRQSRRRRRQHLCRARCPWRECTLVLRDGCPEIAGPGWLAGVVEVRHFLRVRNDF